MLVSFDIKLIRQDHKQDRNGEACRASPWCFWSSLMNLISINTYMLFYLTFIIRIRRKQNQTNEKQTQFCSNLLMSQMLYDFYDCDII